MLTQSPLGISFQPFKAIKKVGRGIESGAKPAGRGIKKAAEAASDVALWPIRKIIGQTTMRRARKLSWDRRKSLKPNKAEMIEAKAWTKAQFRKKGPHGQIIAALAGPPNSTAFGAALGVLPAAMVPVLVAVAAAVATQVAKSGGAPADPRIGTKTAEATKAALGPGSLETRAEKYTEEQLTPDKPKKMPAAQRMGPAPKTKEPTADDITEQADQAVETAATEDSSTMEGFALGYTALDGYEDADMLRAIDPPSNVGTWVAIALGAVAAGTGVAVALKK